MHTDDGVRDMMTAGRVRMLAWSGAAALLPTAPLVAMRFTNEVAWTVSDFVAAAVLLLGAGLALELLAQRARGPALLLGGLAVIGVFLLLWAEGAVGVF
jgi:hypothetical protein